MTVNDVERFMQHAIDMAEKGLENGYLPVGAVIVYRDRIIAADHNHIKSGRSLLEHAEFRVIHAMEQMTPRDRPERKQLALFATLEPCMMCLGAATNAHIGRLYYGLEAKEDAVVDWALQWDRRRPRTARRAYRLPTISSSHQREACRQLFESYATRFANSPFADWARSLSVRSTGESTGD